jgi:hypothetical protein
MLHLIRRSFTVGRRQGRLDRPSARRHLAEDAYNTYRSMPPPDACANPVATRSRRAQSAETEEIYSLPRHRRARLLQTLSEHPKGQEWRKIEETPYRRRGACYRAHNNSGNRSAATAVAKPRRARCGKDVPARSSLATEGAAKGKARDASSSARSRPSARIFEQPRSRPSARG